MQAMREVLRSSLRRTLEGVREEDRIAAAWSVACGPAMAGRGEIVDFRDGVVRVAVTDAVWLRQMSALRVTLQQELTRISGVKVDGLELVLKRGSRGRDGGK